MVYAPMVNPLTGQTIGPDREHPKGILRFIGWESKTATFYVAAAFNMFLPQDVVADLHEWKDGRFVLSPLLADPFWWAPLGLGGKDGRIPVTAKMLPLNWNPAHFPKGDRWYIFQDSTTNKTRVQITRGTRFASEAGKARLTRFPASQPRPGRLQAASQNAVRVRGGRHERSEGKAKP